MAEKEIQEDFLNVDQPIPGQNFVCLSFVSPENILKQKGTYYIHEFLKEHAKEYGLSQDEVTEKYDDFAYHNKDRIEEAFYKENDFQTTTRGVKVRGIYDTQREASVRAKLLQKKDPNFHVFVGQVGYWLPWDPSADDIENQEYTEDHLNKLVKNYQDNKKKKDVFFEQQKKESLEKMKADNEKAKAKQVEDGEDAEDGQETQETQESAETSTEESTEESTEKSTEKDTDESPPLPPQPESSVDVSQGLDSSDPWVQRKLEKTLDLDA